jgi:predicted transcriptional regulator
VIARQLASEMKKKKITKQRMALLMKTSRAQVGRLLDPDNGSATIESLQRAARIVGRELRLQLVYGCRRRRRFSPRSARHR